MKFEVVAMQPAEFDRWVANQSRPAPSPKQRGLEVWSAAISCPSAVTSRCCDRPGRVGPVLSLGRQPGDALRHTAWGSPSDR